MKNKRVVLGVPLLVMIVFLIISCSDTLEKSISLAESVRIEYSSCIGCQECILDFTCPQNAVKFDSLRVKAYIDADRCVQCMDCMNLFNCPENAFSRLPDNEPPAAITDLQVESDLEKNLIIQFTATGDDSTSGKAYSYELDLRDDNDQPVYTNFEPPLPINAGFTENWLIPDLPVDICIHIRIRAFDEMNNASPSAIALITIPGNHFPPATIDDLTITDLNAESFRLSWTAVGNNGLEGVADHYIVKIHDFEINEVNWPEIDEYEQSLVPVASGETENLLITGLQPLTQYFAAVKAVDDSSYAAALSNVATATTLETPDLEPPAAISDLTATSPEMNSFVLNWTAVGDDGQQGTASAYIIKIHSEMITNDNWDDIIPLSQNLVPAPSGTDESFIVNNLEPLTTYYASIIAVDEAANSSEISNVANATTTEIPDTDPPAAITDLTAEGFETMIELSWTATGDDGNIGTAFCYEIRYSETEITEANWIDAVLLPDPPIPSLAGTTQSYSAMNLTVGIEYYFAIKAFDESDNVSPISNVPNAHLIEDVTAPAAITDLAAEGFETTIELVWTAPGDDGMTGTAESYEIRMHDAEITEANWNAAELLPNPPLPLEAGTIQNYSAQGLNYNLLYFFAIKTFDDNANVSEVSNSPSAQLIEDTIPPADITDLTVFAGYASNLSTIKIEWTAPGDDGSIGTADHYEIRYSQQPITAANWQNANLFPDPPTPLPAGSSQFCNVTGLNAATIYYFAIRAFDDAGNGNNVSNSPAGKIVYQINTAACHNCNNCINDCSVSAIHQGPGYKYINPDQCIACGDCSCPWNLIYMAVVAY